MRQRLVQELPNAAVTMVAVLASFFAALAIKDVAGLNADTMVLAVAIALTNARLRRGDGRHERLRSVVLFPVIAVVANEVGRLMLQTPWLGDTLFVLALSAGIWLRRFGTVWSRVGTVIALPFIAILIAPGAGGTGSAGHQTLWTLVVSATVVVIVNLVQLAAQELGFVTEQKQSKARSRAAQRGEARRSAETDAFRSASLGRQQPHGAADGDRSWRRICDREAAVARALELGGADRLHRRQRQPRPRRCRPQERLAGLRRGHRSGDRNTRGRSLQPR